MKPTYICVEETGIYEKDKFKMLEYHIIDKKETKTDSLVDVLTMALGFVNQHSSVQLISWMDKKNGLFIDDGVRGENEKTVCFYVNISYD